MGAALRMPDLSSRPLSRTASCAGLAWTLLTAAVGGAAWAADPDTQAQAWAASCITCHASTARPGAAIAPLEGLAADWITTRMRTLTRAPTEGNVMAQIARGYSDAEIVRIARWFAAQPKATTP